MKLISNLQINIKKLRFRFRKSLFLILPVTVLVILSSVAISQVQNIRTALSDNVFAEIDEEMTILELNYPIPEPTFGGGTPGDILGSNEYSELDVQNIENIDNVTAVAMNYDLPIANIQANGLFDNTSLSLSNLNVLSSEMASLYTSDDFEYEDGQAIPIILNANQFVETYQEWNGSDSYTVDFRSMRMSGADMAEATPIRNSAISYDKADLLGKTFSITFGGFDEIENYETTRESGVITMSLLSDEEVAAKEAERASVVGEYWDYSTLQDGVTYEFVVAGVIESETNNSVYIPENFADVLVNDYLQLQLDSLNTTPDVDYLGNVFTGITYDGTELTSLSSMMGNREDMPFKPGAGGGNSEDNTTSESYEIPGLVLEIDDSQDVLGLWDDTSVFEDSVKSGDTLLVKIDSIVNRSSVVEALNEAGYSYQDLSNLDVFDNLENTLSSISNGAIWSFIILSSVIILFTMGKFVSESKKEIGIYRAIGFTKGNILTIFLTQSILYTLIGYLSGLMLALIVNIIVGGFVGNWFVSFISGTVAQTVGVIQAVDTSIFSSFDWNSVGTVSIIFAVITIVASVFPSSHASNVSPVEAIKSE